MLSHADPGEGTLVVRQLRMGAGGQTADIIPGSNITRVVWVKLPAKIQQLRGGELPTSQSVMAKL